MTATRTRCHGQYSIQAEINNIIHDKYPRPEDWRPRITSRKFRAAVKAELMKITTEWCDTETGVCACDDRKPVFA